MRAPLLTIDLDAVARNWRALDQLSGAAETGAAVKANAYGLGIGPVSLALWGAGCRSFFVATLDEGVSLRGSLPDATVYVLNGVSGDGAMEARGQGLVPCLNAPHQVAAWRVAGGGACALHVDTGMGRLGVEPEGLARLVATERETLADCTLVMSHLACADEPGHSMNEVQRAAFEAMRPALPHARASLAATGGTLLGADFRYDMVRCGIGLFGGMPFAEAEPVVTLTAPVIQVRDVPEGGTVGYGTSWTARRPSRIATLPLGYADGFHRALSWGTQVWIDGRPAPLAGRVSMDLLTVDVTEFPDLREDAMVEIVGPNRTIDDLATDAGTIGYEMLTALGSRYERRYKGADRN